MLSQKVAKIKQDVQNVNDRFQREISPIFGKVMETEIGKIMDRAVVLSVSESSSQEVVDKYFSSLANKVQSVVSPVVEDIVRKSLQTAINTAMEDAVKRKHQEEIEAQRQRLLNEGESGRSQVPSEGDGQGKGSLGQGGNGQGIRARRSILGRREESIAQEKAEELQADDFTEFSDSPISSHVRMRMDEFEDLALRKDMKDVLQANMIFYANKAHPGSSRNEPKLVEAKRAKYRRVMTAQLERELEVGRAECCEKHFAKEAVQRLKEYETDKAAIRDDDKAEQECYCCQAHAAPAVRSYVEDPGVETALEPEETSVEPVGALEGSGPDSR
eukprot:g81352.t1